MAAREVRLRDEEPPADTTLVVRGGALDHAAMLAQIEDAAKAFRVGERPLRGFSVEGVTPAWPLERILLEGRVRHRSTYATCTVAEQAALGCEVLATFGDEPPHFTVMLPDPIADALHAVITLLQPRVQLNPNRSSSQP